MSEPYQFNHEAMKTTFTFRISGEDQKLAKDVAHASGLLLDEIENALSRYIEGSDVWMINRMQADETRFLGDHTYACIRQAVDAYIETAGLFDITLGRQIEHQKSSSEGPPPALSGQLMVDPEKPAIHCTEAGREIDLGGIGKGYALDQIKTLMQEWGIESALLSAGSSTQLAFGPKAWTIELTGDHGRLSFKLLDEALSASGTEIQGSHIVSPTMSAPDYTHARIWCIHSSASMADAWSTAALLMKPETLKSTADRGLRVYAEVKKTITQI